MTHPPDQPVLHDGDKPVTAILLSPLQTQALPNGRLQLLADLELDLGEDLGIRPGIYPGFTLIARPLPRRTKEVIPKGATTDLSSIPWGVRNIMGRWDKHQWAGVAHDHAYDVGVPRDKADRIWWIVARSGSNHVNVLQGWLGWAGLRIGGWVAYRRHRKGDAG